MPLIIEDGSIVADANSFASVVECRAYAETRGLDLPDNDGDVEALLINACDYLFSLEIDFQGVRIDPGQELPFPRDGVQLFHSDVSGLIPEILKKAQCRLAFDASQNDLLATGGGRVVKKEGIGPLAVEYADDGASNPQVDLTAALTILKPLFKDSSSVGGGNINFTVAR